MAHLSGTAKGNCDDGCTDSDVDKLVTYAWRRPAQKMADPDASALAKALISKNKARQQEALNAFLVAAESLAQKGQIIEAELRFKQALQTAEKAFGKDSDQAMLVLSILAAFYHVHKRTWEARQVE